MRPHQIQKLFDAIDLDGDGEVTYAELVDFLVEQTEE
jgi:Ca2+-binding EF-hand superfamily protein